MKLLRSFFFLLTLATAAAQTFPTPQTGGVSKAADGTHNITADLAFGTGRTQTFRSGSTLSLLGTLSGTPTGGTLNLSAVTLTLGAITPASVNGVTLSGSSTPTLAVTGTTAVSGTNTGDQTITLTGEVTGTGTGSFAATLTNSAVIGKVLTGYTSGAGTVAATDTILQAVQKLNGNAANLQPLDSDLTAIAALSTTAFGRSFLPLADAAAGRTLLGLGTLATQSGTFSGTSSGTNTGDQTITLTGEVTGTGTGSFAATLTNSAVIGKVLTGYTSGAGTVAATDTILQAVQKLNGNAANLQPLDAELTAISGLAANGLIARTSASSAAARTLTGTTAELTVTNGDGVAGNPTVSLPSALTFTGKTVTGGTFASPTLTTPTIGDGSAAAPSLSFTSETTTGLFRPSASVLGITVAGTSRATLTTTGMTVAGTITPTGSVHGAAGTVGNPALSFNVDQDTGLYHIGSNNLGVAAGGAKVLDVATTGLGVTGALSASGVFSFSGASAFPGALGSDGIARGYASSANGLVLYGRGSTNDVFIADRNGSDILKVVAAGDTIINSVSSTVLLQTAGVTRAAFSSTGVAVTGRVDFAGSPTFAAGSIYVNAVNGVTIAGKTGSSNDFLLANNNGNTVFANPTGTTNVQLPGAYVNTTGNAANVFVASDGLLQRSTSSLRYKTDLKPYKRGLADAAKLNLFTYRAADKPDSTERFAGVGAEEMDALGFTEFVEYGPVFEQKVSKTTDPKTGEKISKVETVATKTLQPEAVRYANMVVWAFACINELSAKNDSLRARVAQLEAQNQSLDARMAAVEALLKK